MKVATVGFVVMVGLLGGWAAGCREGGDESLEEEGSPAKRKKKGGDDAGAEGGGDAALDVMATFGADAAFGGSFDRFGEAVFGAINHSPEEPSNFSAGWVGQEAWNVLQRARKGELPHKQVRLPSRRLCLVFTENNVIRRAMIATTQTAPTEELAFSAAGNLILWYRHNRSKPAVEDWAYFHRNHQLMLYQVKNEGSPRATVAAPATLREAILGGAGECVQAAGASNPQPGTAPPPPPAPQGSAFFGALAVSNAAAAWSISYNLASEDAAKNDAMRGCTHPDCSVRAVFTSGQCLAVVHGPPPLVTWGWANDNNSAETAALGECTKQGHAAAACTNQGTWCNNRAQGQATPPPAPAPAPAPAPPPVAPAPGPVGTFEQVALELWQPRLGPKMVRGSEVVHPVFAGPFGPSAKSLFAVTRRPNNTFYVYVMGDDNQPWPAGPLAEPDLDIAHKIAAVAFFDADGDSTTDALVMAQYMTVRGAGPYHKNVLLRWTNQGLRRMLKLEPKIEALDSVAAVRAKLGR
jgi:hypothetical protein